MMLLRSALCHLALLINKSFHLQIIIHYYRNVVIIVPQGGSVVSVLIIMGPFVHSAKGGRTKCVVAKFNFVISVFNSLDLSAVVWKCSKKRYSGSTSKHLADAWRWGRSRCCPLGRSFWRARHLPASSSSHQPDGDDIVASVKIPLLTCRVGTKISFLFFAKTKVGQNIVHFRYFRYWQYVPWFIFTNM